MLFIKRKNINFNPRSIIGDTGWAILTYGIFEFCSGLISTEKMAKTGRWSEWFNSFDVLYSSPAVATLLE